MFPNRDFGAHTPRNPCSGKAWRRQRVSSAELGPAGLLAALPPAHHDLTAARDLAEHLHAI
ncbi:MAG: hypothetical protein ACRDZO_12700, partial [Egibacteraceae bacterium]